jgi:hypothetical protein
MLAGSEARTGMSAPAVMPGAVPAPRRAAGGAATAGTLEELADRLAVAGSTVVDVDELAAAIEAIGIKDELAQRRYGVPTVFALAERVLGELARRRPARPTRTGRTGRTERTERTERTGRDGRIAADGAQPVRYLGAAAIRCGLYLTPALLAVAAAEPLDRVGWAMPAAGLLLGWAGAQALAYLGHHAAAVGGPVRGGRRLAAGFAALAAAWGVVLALAPPAFVGPDRGLGYAIGLAELALFATVAAALVTRAEAAVLRWTLPVWAVSGVVLADAWPQRWPEWWPWVPVPAGVALLAAATLPLLRAYAPIVRRVRTPRPGLRGAELAAAAGYALVGLGQAGAFVLVWRAAPDGAPPPAMLPLLAAVPLIEILVGWHGARAGAALEAHDELRAYRRQLRGLATLTLATVVPPLVAGVALAATAHRLPFGLSAHPDARTLVLALAAGVLLAGVFAVTLLLAARRRLRTAAAVAVAPAALTLLGGLAVPAAGLDSLAGWSADLLPRVVVVLAAVYVLSLGPAAHAIFDHRSYR